MPDYHLNIIVNGRDQASGALRGVAGALGGIAQFALGGLLASGLQRVAAGIGGVAREALAGAEGMQNLTIALETLAAREMVASGEAENLQEGLAQAGPVAAALKDELRALSLTSPFEARQVEDAFRLQMAFGATGESAIETAGAILDTGAALGMTNEMMGRMSYNLAQALQQGDLTAANLRQLKMVGLDLADVFKSELGMSIEDVREALKSGEMTAADVSAAFVKYADENFGGAAERMSHTFGGLKSSVKDLLYYGGADLLSPALERITEIFGGLFDRARGLVESGAVAAIGEQLGGVIDRVVAFIGRVGEGGIGALFPPEVVANVGAFLAGLQPVGEILQNEIIPAVVGFLPTLQMWGEQLLTLASSALPLLAEGLQFVAENWEIFAAIGGVIVGILVAINAPIVAVIAALAALYLAWENNWGGIRTFVEAVAAGLQPVLQNVGSFIQGTVVPILSSLAEMARTVVATAITVLTEVWQNVLYPALQIVWSFIQSSVIPLYQTLAEVLSATVGVALTAAAGILQNVLRPAFETVANFVQATVGPVLEHLGNAVLPALAGAFDAIGSAIQGVVDWLRRLADRIANISLPDWMQPGSPTPLELGLRGIADALREVEGVMGGVGMGAGAGFGLGRLAGAGAGGGGWVVVAPVMIREEEYRGVGGEWDWQAIAELVSGVEERIAAGF